MENNEIIEGETADDGDVPLPAKIEEKAIMPADDALAFIEQRAIRFGKVMEVAIGATNSRDWVDMGGNPYLQGTGAEKVARRFGISITDVRTEKEKGDDRKGPYIIYKYFGIARLGERESLEAFGSCSTRDKFFGKTKEGYKPLDEIDLPNIQRKAYNNMLRNAVTRMLGLRSLTWEELEKWGVTRKGKAKVEYKTKKSSGDDSKNATLHSEQKRPYWTYKTNDGNELIYAKAGDHFSEEDLEFLRMRPSKKDPKIYYATFSEDLELHLAEIFDMKEEQK